MLVKIGSIREAVHALPDGEVFMKAVNRQGFDGLVEKINEFVEKGTCRMGGCDYGKPKEVEPTYTPVTLPGPEMDDDETPL